MDETGKSVWCREHGVFPAELDKWRMSATTALAEPEDVRASPQATRADKQRIKELERELRRTDKALAETAALLVLSKGVYLASASTFSRVLKAHGQMTHRGPAKPPTATRPPTTHIATGPRQVWCWDMTYLPKVMGRWFYLYLILDLYSRKIVDWEIHETYDADDVAHLLRRTALAEGIAAMASKPVLHGDNGSTLKATTVLAMLHWLGVKPSGSRPRVSDDNAFAEALLRTAKYRPEFPATGFADLDAARNWAASFVHWYNLEHRHSGIRYVSPAQCHAGDDQAILAVRQQLYLPRAKEIRHAGPAIRVTGHPSVPLCSIQNATRS